jgi:hypothetical protein
MRNLFYILLLLGVTDCLGQTTPNFKPFTRNTSYAAANESAVKELLDTTVRKFLLIANDAKSALHKTIQDEFASGRETDRLESYNYPKKLGKNHLTVQFLNWTEVHGIYGNDSAWSNETLTAMVFIPVMTEEQKGSSVSNLCFKTDLEISTLDKLDGGTAKPKISFQVSKIDLGLIDGTVMYK